VLRGYQTAAPERLAVGLRLCDYFRIAIPAWVERSAQPTRSAPTDVMFGPLSPGPREPRISGHSRDGRQAYQNLIGWGLGQAARRGYAAETSNEASLD
jgi:hypothetical protein